MHRSFSGDTSFTSTRENRRPSERVQLLVGNVKSTKLTTLCLKLHGCRQREAAVRYKKNGCRISTRPSDRPGTDDDRPGAETRRRLVRTPKRPVRVTRPFITTRRFRVTWLFRMTWQFGSTRSPQDLTVDTAAEPLE